MPVLGQAQAPPRYIIKPAVGTGTLGFSGDGGAATAAELSQPYSVVLDASGNLYIADQVNSRVRKVTPDGTITTIAGNGTNGFSGDGKAGTSAELYFPCGVAVDSSGNVYIADTDNHVVRKLATSGTISTFAGINAAGFVGDTGAATSAELNYPVGLALDAAGNLYIADSANNRIRMVATDGTITTFAGDGNPNYAGDGGAATGAELNDPQGVAVDSAGAVYIADTGNHVIRKVSTDGTISTVAGNGAPGYAGDGGPATLASFNYPKSVVVDAGGNLFITDSFNSRIRVVTEDGTVTTVAGNGELSDTGDGGPADSASLRFPSGAAMDAAGDLYIADTQNNRIRLLTPQGDLPSINNGGVIGAAGFGAFSSAAPGSWIEIYGMKLASVTLQWTAADFNGTTAPTSLGGTSVSIGGVPAFVSYVSPAQVNALVPSNAGLGPQDVTVTTAAGTSAPHTLNLYATQPALNAPPSFMIGGRQYAAAVLDDGVSYALPTGAIPNIAAHPAQPGETIVIFGTGFGPVTPSVDAGQIAPQSTALNLQLRMYVGQKPATVTYAGLAPGAVGLYQFNVVVPALADNDAAPVSFTLNGAPGKQTLYIAVKN